MRCWISSVFDFCSERRVWKILFLAGQNPGDLRVAGPRRQRVWIVGAKAHGIAARR